MKPIRNKIHLLCGLLALCMLLGACSGQTLPGGEQTEKPTEEQSTVAPSPEEDYPSADDLDKSADYSKLIISSVYAGGTSKSAPVAHSYVCLYNTGKVDLPLQGLAVYFCGGDYVDMYSNIQHVAAAGDCEDHIKIVFTGINGRIVDMEISGGVAIKDPVYVIHGTRGSLVSTDETRLHLKYMNPAIPLPEVTAKEGNPKGFGCGFNPEWVEDDLQVAPANGNTTHVIWRELYEAIRNGKEFPIKFEEAREVVRVTEMVRQGAIDNARDHEF